MKVKFHVSPHLAIAQGNEQFGGQTIDLDLAKLTQAQRNLLPHYLKNNIIDLTELRSYYEIPTLNEKIALQTIDLIIEKQTLAEDKIVQEFLWQVSELDDLDQTSKEADKKFDRLLKITSGNDDRYSSVVMPFLINNPTVQGTVDQILKHYTVAKEEQKLRYKEEILAKKQKLKDWIQAEGPKLIKDRMELGFDYEEIAAKTQFEQQFDFLNLPKFDNKDYSVLSQYNRTKPSQYELDVFRQVKEQLKDMTVSLDLIRFKYRHNDDVDNEYTVTTELEISGLDLLGLERSIYFWIKEEDVGF